MSFRVKLAQSFESLAPVPRVANYFDVWLGAEEAEQPTPNDVVVVHDQDANDLATRDIHASMLPSSTGSSIRTSVPRPGLLSTRMSAPISVARLRIDVSP